jgi:hypothetical protein
LSRSSSFPVALLHRPTAIWPSMVWPRQQWLFFSFLFSLFFRIALVSLLASHWHHCQHQAVLVAGVALALLPSWPSKVRPVQRWRLPALRWHFACIAPVSLPALCCCHCCQRCAGVVALGMWASLPSLCTPCGGVCPSTVIAVCGVLAVSGIIYAHPLFSVT